MSEASVLFDAPGPRARARYRIVAVTTSMLVGAFLVLAFVRLGEAGVWAYDQWEVFVTPTYMNLLLVGTVQTLLTAVVAIIGALVVGVVMSAGKLSDHVWIRWPAWAFVEFFRAVPLLLLILFIWFYLLTPVADYRALVIGLALYNGSVLAEVFRAGIQSLPSGQAEAAYALGMTKSQVMRMILYPQAAKVMFPTIISQCVVALKDTSLGYVVVAPGLTKVGKELWGTFSNQIAMIMVLALIYIALNVMVTWIGGIIQRRYTGRAPSQTDESDTSSTMGTSAVI